MSKPVAIVWFRDDLRLADNSALAAAVENGLAVLPVFILDDANLRPPGGASRWWLQQSLKALDTQLKAIGGELYFFTGDSKLVLQGLIAEYSANALYFNRCYEPAGAALEHSVYQQLMASGDHDITVKRFAGSLLFDPDSVTKDDGTPYKVFTPFYKRCLQQVSPARQAKLPQSIVWTRARPASSSALSGLGLQPTIDWYAGLQASWHPGEEGAFLHLRRFTETALEHYHEQRDLPGVEGTSQLSPHLHFGEISPRVVWHEVELAAAANPALATGASAYLRELVWRDFCYYLLHHWPELTHSPFKAEFSDFPWQRNEQLLKAWQRGQTGYPLVDAGMRQLWETGWMHNRVRMVAASFLVKHLLQHWKDGERWFWDTLVDADLANNVSGWQWVAGCGADAAPYFRIFNPILQSEKFDRDGDYIRRFVPELAKLPTRYLHEPAKAPEAALRDAGVTLGLDYPLPIVEHQFARERALQALKSMPRQQQRGS